MAARRAGADPVTVEVTVRGAVAEEAVPYARTKVAHVVEKAHEPVLAAHVVLTAAPDPAVQRWARAEASLDLNGTPLRAHATASDMLGAVDLLEGKLRRTWDSTTAAPAPGTAGLVWPPSTSGATVTCPPSARTTSRGRPRTARSCAARRSTSRP